MKHFALCLSLALALSATAYAKPPCKKPAQGNHSNHDSSKSTSDSNSNSSSKSGVSNSGNSSSTAKGGNATAQGGSATLSNAGNSSNTNSNTASGGAGGQGGNATGGAGGSSSATTGASNSSTSVSNSNSYQQVRQASSAYAPDALPSAPCRVGGSAGVSSPFGGVSLGGSKLDKECDRRETARAFALLGNKLAAARILCNTKAAKEAQLTFLECSNYAEGYIGDGNDADGPVFKAPAKK
jgi:hypothetical protein